MIRHMHVHVTTTQPGRTHRSLSVILRGTVCYEASRVSAVAEETPAVRTEKTMRLPNRTQREVTRAEREGRELVSRSRGA